MGMKGTAFGVSATVLSGIQRPGPFRPSRLSVVHLQLSWSCSSGRAGSGLDRVLSGRAPCQQERGGREVKEGQVQASSERLPRRAPGWTVAWVWSWVLGAAVSKGLDRWLGGVTRWVSCTCKDSGVAAAHCEDLGLRGDRSPPATPPPVHSYLPRRAGW